MVGKVVLGILVDLSASSRQTIPVTMMMMTMTNRMKTAVAFTYHQLISSLLLSARSRLFRLIWSLVCSESLFMSSKSPHSCLFYS